MPPGSDAYVALNFNMKIINVIHLYGILYINLRYYLFEFSFIIFFINLLHRFFILLHGLDEAQKFDFQKYFDRF